VCALHSAWICTGHSLISGEHRCRNVSPNP
jgi:hypothetical protein